MKTWDDALVERVNALWHQRIEDGRFRYTSGEIAKMVGVSRNALLGKATRLGFTPRPTSGRRRLDVPQPPRSVPLTDHLPPIKIKLADRSARDSGQLPCCKPLWALGETPTHLFCGAIVPEGQYYCQAHDWALPRAANRRPAPSMEMAA